MKSDSVSFVLDNRIVEIDFSQTPFRPSTTVLNYLRMLPEHRGTKEGCAEGDCGACTVVLGELGEDNRISYKAVDSCMLFLASIHGKQLITVENLVERNGTQLNLHPVQQAMVDKHGSQCGFCTPGIVMSLFAFYNSGKDASRKNIVDALSGNLCRCTGYDAIFNAAKLACENRKPDHFDVNEKNVVEMLQQIKQKKQSLNIQHNNQSYFLPATLDEALILRSQNPDALVVNGATDTAIKQNKKFEFHNKMLDISAVNELKLIREQTDGYYLSAGTTIEKLKDFSDKNIPELNSILNVFASLQIRNVATIGGNLCTASPIGDLIPLMFALKAKFEIAGLKEIRWVNSEDFIVGYRKNCIHPDELLKGILIPKMDAGVIVKSEKVSNRHDLDISTVSLAMRLKLDEKSIIKEITLAYGGMAEVTKRAKNAEEFLLGKEWSRESVEAAMMLIHNDFTPISDARAGKEYRITVAGNLLLKMFLD